MTDTLFREKAPHIMALLMADFGLDAEGAAAILGNLGHESGGFKFLQEIKPTVAGSAGGWGWAQWTASRRVAFDAYVERNGLDPASDKANYGWLWVELKGEYARAISAIKAATGLYNKVVAFELAFERAGVKAYDSRLAWANKALAAFHAAGDPAAVKPPVPTSPQPVQGLDPQRLQEIIAAILPTILTAIVPLLTGKPAAAPVVVAATAPKPADTSVRTDVRAGLIGLAASLGLSATGVTGDFVGPAATLTGSLLPLLSVILPAAGIPSAAITAGGAALRVLGPMLGKWLGQK